MSVVYLFSWIALGGGFLFYQKSKIKQQLFCWLPVVFLSVACFDVLIAAFFSAIHVPVNILSVGLANILTSIYFWYDILKYKKRQEYTFHFLDVVFAAVLLMIVCICAYKQFGPDFRISYLTIDPSVHLQGAMDIVNSQAVSGMYFAQFGNAMFIETFSPLLSSAFDVYKLFIIADVGMLYLSGLMLYALIRRLFRTKFLQITGMILTFVYILGYPLNNMLYGFTYLGVGVTITGFIIYGTECFLNAGIKRAVCVGMLSLGLLALMLCYLLFVPVVMLSVFICLTVYLARGRKLFKKSTLLEYALIFLLPIIIGILYSYSGIFGQSHGGTTVGGAIALEGAIYRSLIANFVIFMPFVIYAVWKLLKERKNSPFAVMFLLLIIFMAGLLVLGLKGEVSSYYFYKNYYLLSLLYFCLAFYGITYLAEKAFRFVCSYFLVWILLAGVAFSNLEARINAVNPLFAPDITMNQMFGIYLYNNYFISNGQEMDGGMYDLYKYVAENREGTYVPNIDGGESRYWFEALTNQRMSDEEEALYKEDPKQWIENILQDDEIQYILVFPSYDIVQPYLSQFDSMPKLYENAAGFVVEKQ